MAIKDELFDKVLVFNRKKILKVDFCKNEAKIKWMKVFSGNDFFLFLYKSVCIGFSLPLSTTFVERMCFLVDPIGSMDQKQVYSTKTTIKSLLQVKVNLDYSCRQIKK